MYVNWGGIRNAPYTSLHHQCYRDIICRMTISSGKHKAVSKPSVQESWGKVDMLYTEEQISAEGFSQLASPLMNVEEFPKVCGFVSIEPWTCKSENEISAKHYFALSLFCMKPQNCPETYTWLIRIWPNTDSETTAMERNRHDATVFFPDDRRILKCNFESIKCPRPCWSKGVMYNASLPWYRVSRSR